MIYLDYAAATPVDKRVLKLMEPYLDENFGNASSIHKFGQTARRAIDEARSICMKILGAQKPSEIIFTGGGTESCNMAIFGRAFARGRGHIIVSAIEHPSVLEPARYLRDNFGFTLTEVAPDENGIISADDIAKEIKAETILVSVMYANNEIGTIQPIKKIAKICRKKKVVFHTDACQAPGFLDINAEHLGVDLMTLNGSKIYGPKGAGLLYIREGIKITPLILGGGQEFRLRGGTENPALIYGFAKALELKLKDGRKEADRVKKLRDKLLNGLLNIKGVTLNGDSINRLPNNINIRVKGKKNETLVMRLDIEGLAVSGGSACSSGKTEPSNVLLALGQTPKEASESLRLTLGSPTDAAEIGKALAILKKVLNKLLITHK